MKIAESSIQFLSQHTLVEKYQKQETLAVWGPGEDRVTQGVNGFQERPIDVEREFAAFGKASNVEFSKQAMHTRRAESAEAPPEKEPGPMLNLNMRILKAMIERITGKSIDLVSSDTMQPASEEVVTENVEAVPEELPQGGFAYDSYESHYEYESSSFSSSGKIITEDGQEIDFAVQLTMSREFFSEERISIRAGDALKDPLVINFSGTAAELTQDTFSFDIDNDGHENQISFLRPGSGFLALDKNGDNIINNGSELFGPESGNGFADLAAYDADGNGWIDENDSIFDKLRIWTKDAQGNDILFGLGEKGIGAIYLESAATLFSMKDSDNNLLGQTRSTGIFLGEEGGVGTVQQIDLVA